MQMPSQLTRRDSDTNNVESDDPLSRDALLKSHSQSPTKQYPRSPNASQGTAVSYDRPKFAVVLNQSPVHRDAFQEVSVQNDDFDALVISDLTSRGKPRTLFNPLARLDPSGQSTAGSSDTGSNTAARGRGRPRGSGKKHLSQVTAAASRQVRQVKPRPHPNGFPKRRGRPPKQPSPPPTTIYRRVNAPLFAFLCEWHGCKAELHNLETLRRHVYIVHGDSAECLWGKCGRREQPCEFDDDEGFREHVEETHLVPMSWHVGDGPNNAGVAATREAVPDYLKDEDGNQVTPSIRGQQEEDIVTYRNNRRKLRELLIRLDDSLPEGTGGEVGDDSGAS
ncbi:hypothetical protein FZEAL_2637 [Fusarium zealandicum]|uniref:C2H2-type domain-containing protein n=1 Tax=Fusarium zealandicum TaxID=1053134 RepID=A0A8H4XMK1_9HYPO|nr:hypothetical protein FZEAL_2637 [Fusarium zealandicum]